MMRAAIIVCARLKSRRVPNKCVTEINGKPILQHLHDRLLKTGLQIIYAVPQEESSQFMEIFSEFSGSFNVYAGDDEDPLRRMFWAAKAHDVDTIIRITHDKIFVDTDAIFRFLDEYWRNQLHYVYGSALTPGSGFEIIALWALEEAAKKYRNVEHVSYAIRNVTERKLDARPAVHADFEDVRLLIDFPEDIELMKRIFGILGNDCTLDDVLRLLVDQPWLTRINRMPMTTIYTCAYNAEKWIEKCMGSVSAQSGFRDHEYVLVDDCSTDRTALLMAKFAALYPNVTYIRNSKNVGLASSSNVALENARGKFIVRLDADDYFTTTQALSDLLKAIAVQGCDVIYPNNYFGKMDFVQHGKDSHHVGGALFRTRALNHIKFTDGLRGYEGYDLFKRAQKSLKIGYLSRPIFMYRQHDGSMSKTNLAERERIKHSIDQGGTP